MSSVSTSRITQVTVDAHDPPVLAEFWSAALGYLIEAGDDGCAKLYPPSDAAPEAVTVWLQSVTEPKSAKNRVHLDLNAEDGDREVARLRALGASRVDVGQQDRTRSWCWPIRRGTSSACCAGPPGAESPQPRRGPG